MQFNPFSILLRSKTSPFSEILRHDFISKMNDTFFIFFGYLGPIDRLGLKNLGLADYLSLGILTLPALLTDYLNKQQYNSKTLSILHAMSYILYVPSILIRATVAMAGTLLSLPFICITHLFTSFIAKKDLDKALKLKVLSASTENGQKSCSLKEALDQMQKNHPQLTVHHALHQDGIAVSMTISDINAEFEPVGEHFEGTILALPKKRPIDDPEQNEAFSALLRLNLFSYTTQLESINHPSLRVQPRI